MNYKVKSEQEIIRLKNQWGGDAEFIVKDSDEVLCLADLHFYYDGQELEISPIVESVRYDSMTGKCVDQSGRTCDLSPMGAWVTR